MEVSELFYTFALPNSNYMDELQNIQNLIYVIRGQRVMLDFDLAMLYEVETRSLNQTVKRNARRFPDDFMFQICDDIKNEAPQEISTIRFHRTWCLDAVECAS